MYKKRLYDEGRGSCTMKEAIGYREAANRDSTSERVMRRQRTKTLRFEWGAGDETSMGRVKCVRVRARRFSERSWWATSPRLVSRHTHGICIHTIWILHTYPRGILSARDHRLVILFYRRRFISRWFRCITRTALIPAIWQLQLIQNDGRRTYVLDIISGMLPKCISLYLSKKCFK